MFRIIHFFENSRSGLLPLVTYLVLPFWLLYNCAGLADEGKELAATGTELAEEASLLADWSKAFRLHPGILIQKIRTDSPRPIVLHAIQIDLKTPGLALSTTPRANDWQENKSETVRQTTRGFLRKARLEGKNMVLAVNADSFSPWPAPYQQETPADIGGLAASEGIIVSPPAGTPSLVIDKKGLAAVRVIESLSDQDNIQLAVSGFAFCLKDGLVQPSGDDLHPRTGLGLSDDGKFLYILVIDGRRFSRQGATTQELGEWLKRLGAHNAINMDGGGSSTLAWWNPNSQASDDDRCELINTPVGSGMKYETPEKDARYRPTERANGNNLGVFYQTAP